VQVAERWARREGAPGSFVAHAPEEEGEEACGCLVWDTSLEVHMLREEVLLLAINGSLKGARAMLASLPPPPPVAPVALALDLCRPGACCGTLSF
jgi:hypothetical protein